MRDEFAGSVNEDPHEIVKRLPHPVDRGHSINNELDRMGKELSELKIRLSCVLHADEDTDAGMKPPAEPDPSADGHTSELMVVLFEVKHKAINIVGKVKELIDHLDL